MSGLEQIAEQIIVATPGMDEHHRVLRREVQFTEDYIKGMMKAIEDTVSFMCSVANAPAPTVDLREILQTCIQDLEGAL